jgi:hypothetical protein
MEMREFDGEMKKAEAMSARVNNAPRAKRAQFGLKRCPAFVNTRILCVNDILRFLIKRQRAYLSFFGSELPFLPLELSAFGIALEPIHAYMLAVEPDACAATAIFSLLVQVGVLVALLVVSLILCMFEKLLFIFLHFFPQHCSYSASSNTSATGRLCCRSPRFGREW